MKANARGDGVVPAPVERMTAQQSPHCEPGPARRAVGGDRLDGVGAAGGRVPAGRRTHGADRGAVEADDGEQHASEGALTLGGCDVVRVLAIRGGGRGHRAPASRPRARSRSAPRSADVADEAAGRARTTVVVPPGSSASRSASWARSRRLTRWRTTLPPTDRLTTSPTSGAAAGSCAARWWTTIRPPRVREPSRTVDEKSVARRIRFRAGNTRKACGRPGQAESSLRPLRRRADTMARPARVRIRSRKPCVLARRRLFGWKVRLLTVGLHRFSAGRWWSGSWQAALRGDEPRPLSC